MSHGKMFVLVAIVGCWMSACGSGGVSGQSDISVFETPDVAFGEKMSELPGEDTSIQDSMPEELLEIRQDVVVPCEDGFVRYQDACCSPSCVNKTCGDDGCGGSCGTCPANQACSTNFSCVLKPCETDAECDDGDPCTVDETCKDGKCQPGTSKVCDDHNPCTADKCEPSTGACLTTDLPEQTPCTSDNVCLVDPACVMGACVGKTKSCDDQNLCTDDNCDPTTGCQNVFNTKPCDDGNKCTTGDKCDSGECHGVLAVASVLCDDQNPCTTESCNPSTGCQWTNNTNTCDDGNPCTVGDTCTAGACIGGTNICKCQTTADCAAYEDGNPCNGTLLCDKSTIPYTCTVNPTTIVQCTQSEDPEVAQCSVATCDPASGTCKPVAKTDGIGCDADGTACTVGDACKNGLCHAGPALDCDDQNQCTEDTCELDRNGAAKCAHKTSAAGKACDADGTPCTAGDSCVGDVCTPGSKKCSDGNPCTLDLCDSKTGACTYDASAMEQIACEDGSQCTVGDKCHLGGCAPGAQALPCDDSNPCTTESCDPLTGCVHTFNTSACDVDGNACTDDHCLQGTCTVGKAKLCEDGNVCTADSCNTATGVCVFDPTPKNGTVCDADGSDCTPVDTCANGTCTPGDPLPPTSQCDDKNACTIGDACDANGACIPGTPKSCDDGNACTADSCNPSTGACISVPVTVGTPCDDGLFCTVNDSCSASGQCGGTARDCNQGGCMVGTCDEVGDQCVGTKLPDGTLCNADDNGCTKNDYCQSGTCQVGAPVNCGLPGDWCNTYSCTSTGTSTYQCTAMPKPVGTYCNDNLFCTVGDACDNAGHCKAGVVRDCSAVATACADGVCNEGAKKCVASFKTDGVACDDGDGCSTGTACKSGFCIGGTNTCGDEDVKVSTWYPATSSTPKFPVDFYQYSLYWTESQQINYCSGNPDCCSHQYLNGTGTPWKNGCVLGNCNDKWNHDVWYACLKNKLDPIPTTNIAKLDEDRIATIWRSNNSVYSVYLKNDLSREYIEKNVGSYVYQSFAWTSTVDNKIAMWNGNTQLDIVDNKYGVVVPWITIPGSQSDSRPLTKWNSAGNSIVGSNDSVVLHISSSGTTSQIRGTGAQQYANGFADGTFVVVWIFNGAVRAQKYAANLQADGAEFQANTTTGNSPVNPRVAPMPNGRYLIYWETNDNSGDIHAQLFKSEAGNKLGSEFTVNTTLAGVQMWPRVGVFPDSGFLVVWEDRNGRDGDGAGIIGRWFSSNGTPTTGERVMNLGWQGGQAIPDVTVNTSGQYASVVWRDETAGHIYLRRFDEHGKADNGIKETLANTVTKGNQKDVAGAAPLVTNVSLGDGSFWLAWASDQADGNGMGVVARRYSVQGTPVGAEFRVNAYSTGDQQRPDVGIDQAGNVVIAWESYGQDGDVEGVYAQRYSNLGAKVGTEFLLASQTANEQLRPDVAVQPNGAFAAVWETYAQPGGSNYDVALRCFDTQGAALGAEAFVNTYTTEKQQRGHIAPFPNGSGLYAVVWQSYDQVAAGKNFDVYLRLYNSNCAAVTDPILVNQTTDGIQDEPSVAVDTEGQITVAWESSTGDGDGYGIYARLFWASATGMSDEFKVNRATVGNQMLPSVSNLPNRNFLIAWQASGEDEDGLAVKATRFEYTGKELALEWMANRTTTGDQSTPRIIGRSNGTWLTTWVSQGQDGDQGGIVFRTSNNGDCFNDADCEDQNICTTNTCVDGKCRASNNTNPCASDGDACTENDTCQNGVCAGTPKTCDDSNICTTDFCDATSGACVFAGIPGCNGGCYYSDAPGCDGCQCETNVCSEMPECCIVGWSSLCVQLCNEKYGGCDKGN